MKSKKLNLFLGIVVTLCALVAIFGLFGEAFGKIGNVPAGRGSAYDLIFQYEKHGYNSMPWLIVGFSFLVCGAVTGLLSAFLPVKIGAISFGLTLLLLVASGVIFLFGKDIFLAAGTVSGATDEDTALLSIGTGFILPAVFGFVGGALSLYGAYSSFKA